MKTSNIIDSAKEQSQCISKMLDARQFLIQQIDGRINGLLQDLGLQVLTTEWRIQGTKKSSSERERKIEGRNTVTVETSITLAQVNIKDFKLIEKYKIIFDTAMSLGSI